MNDLPNKITSSKLWRHLGENLELQRVIYDLRIIAESISNQTARLLPGYTDHSIKHMDTLWVITDQVFTPEEISQFSKGETFILGCSFYVHDLGMALAATQEGLN